MDISRKNMDFLFKSFNMNFASGIERVPDSWQKFCGTIQSGTAANVYPFLEQFGGMREWIGERQLKNVSTRKIEVVNRDFEDTVIIPRNDIEDDQYGIYSTLIAQMGYNAGKIWQDLAVEALMSNPSWIDDTAFFSSSRVYGGFPIVNNSTKELSAETYAAARRSMMEYRGHNGRNLGIVPNLLIVGPKNEAAAFAILKDRLQLRELSAGVGATDNPWNGSAELLVLPELSGDSEDLWFLAAANGILKPLFVQQRKQPSLICLDSENDENVFCRKEYVYGADARGEAFLAFPHLIFRGGAAA